MKNLFKVFAFGLVLVGSLLFTNDTFAATGISISISASPNPVNYNGTTNVTWSSSIATSCSFGGQDALEGGAGSPPATLGPSGTKTFSNLTANKTFTITCIKTGEPSASASVTVIVNPSSPSTTGTLSAPNCTIYAGQNSCDSTISWSITNPVSGKYSTVTVYPETTNIVNTNTTNQGSIKYTIHGSGVEGSSGSVTKTFRLFHDGVQKDYDTAIASCYSGTLWNGTNCDGNVYALYVDKIGTGTGTVSGAGDYVLNEMAKITAVASTGSIFAGWTGEKWSQSTGWIPASDCGTGSSSSVLMDKTIKCHATFNLASATTTATLTQNYPNGYEKSIVKANESVSTAGQVKFTVDIRNLNSGSCSLTNTNLTYNSTIFDTPIINNISSSSSGVTYQISCQNGVSSVSKTIYGQSGTIASAGGGGTATCTIPKGGHTCDSSVNWGTNNPKTTTVLKVGSTVVATANSGSSFTIDGTKITPDTGSKTITSTNNVDGETPGTSVPNILGTLSINVVCAPGSHWNGSICAPDTYTLNVTKIGIGTVTSNPSGISCGLTCTKDFDYNTLVTLTATPDANNFFAGWSGDSDCTDGVVTMGSSKTCIATFTTVTLSDLTATSPLGLQNPSTSISFPFTKPTTNTGSVQCRLLNFNKSLWLIDYTTGGSPLVLSAGNAPSTSGTFGYYIHCRNSTYTSVEKYSNQITININDNPVVNAGADKEISLPTSSVSVTGTVTDTYATPDTYAWTKVSGPNNPTISNPTSLTTNISGLTQGTYVFRLTATDTLGLQGSDSVTVIVNAITTFNLTISKSGSGTVTSSPSGISCGSTCSKEYNINTLVTLSATPDTDSYFAGWTGDSDCIDSSVTMNTDKNCTANFTAVAVSVTANPTQYDVDRGSSVSFTYSSSTNSGNGTECRLLNSSHTGLTTYQSTNPTSISYTIPSSVNSFGYYIDCRDKIKTSVIAESALILVNTKPVITVTQTTNGTIAPGTTSITYGSDKTFTITPNTGYSVAGLTVDGGAVAISSSYTFYGVTSDHSITATYSLTHCANGTTNPPTCTTCSAGSVIIGGQCTPVVVSVVASPLVYNVIPESAVTFTYTASTNSSGGVECKLINFDKSLSLTAYQSTTPTSITYTIPGSVNSFGYYVRCRDKVTTSAEADSAQIVVNAACTPGTTWGEHRCNLPSGALTINPLACRISEGKNSCPVDISWTTAYPLNTVSAVTTEPNNTIVGGGTTTPPSNAGSVNDYEVHYTPPSDGRVFYLYHNEEELDRETVSATCADGLAWNPTGGTSGDGACVTTTGFIQTVGTPCLIPLGASSCSSLLEWDTYYPVLGKTSEVRTPASTSLPALFTANSSTGSSHNFTYGSSQEFFLVHNGKILDSITPVIGCVEGTHWESVKLSPAQCAIDAIDNPNTTFTATPNPILNGGSTTITWNSPLANSGCVGGTIPAGGEFSTGAGNPKSGSVVVSPKANTTYSLTCSNATNTKTFTVSLKVVDMEVKEQ